VTQSGDHEKKISIQRLVECECNSQLSQLLRAPFRIHRTFVLVRFRYRGRVIKNRFPISDVERLFTTILLDEVQCLGTETSIADCPHNGWGVYSCDHSQDVAISCGTSPVQYGDFKDNSSNLVVGGVA